MNTLATSIRLTCVGHITGHSNPVTVTVYYTPSPLPPQNYPGELLLAHY